MRRVSLAILLLLLIAAPSCVGTDVGNPQQDKADVELEFAGYAETQQSALTLESDLQIERAWIVLSQFRFQSESECGTDGPFDATEPVVVDLLADEPSYEAPIFTKPAGDYCKLDLGFTSLEADQLPEGAPSDLAGLSVLVEGQRADGVEFRFEGEFDELFHLNGAVQSFRLEEGRQHLIVGFALNEWINESKLDRIEDEAPILINSESNSEFLGDFSASVKRSANLFRDENGNRRLDADERGQAIASGAQQENQEAGQERSSQQDMADSGQIGR